MHLNVYTFTGVIRKTGLKETIYVNALTQAQAENQASTFADDIVYISHKPLSKDWK